MEEFSVLHEDNRMRIKNTEQLLSHGNKVGREHMLRIIEAGLQASDPYYNARLLFEREGSKLRVGFADFEADNDPCSGIDEYDLEKIRHVYVVGAGKGVQRVAKAVEEVIGDYLTGGHVIAKHGDGAILEKIGLTHGNHPMPDYNCVDGCKAIMRLAEDISENDLVITIMANGCSSLLTMPVEGVQLDDVIELTRLLQIEKGIHSHDLNTIRNHVDQLKGGKIARLFHPAKMIHIVTADANRTQIDSTGGFEDLLRYNFWLHSLPESTTFNDARKVLHLYDAWDACPTSIRRVLEEESSANETVKLAEYRKMSFRIFGIMPRKMNFTNKVMNVAQKLGYKPYLLSDIVWAEAAQTGALFGGMCNTIDRRISSIETPCVLIMTGEMLVTVGEHTGIGGRNQECMLAAVKHIAGSKRIVCGAVDTDGTDGPGGFNAPGAPSCLSGAIVDGYTAEEAEKKSINIMEALIHHDTSTALWALDSAIYAEQGVSLNDLILGLVMEQPYKNGGYRE